tara:strand:+ start:880 stop:1659 length:780 start_codon:yes stop_codon:yes gene_type:complete
MKHTIYIFLFLTSTLFSQEFIETSFVKKTELKVDKLISIDNFGTTYFITNDVFYKKDATKTITYNNLQLGNLETANAFNPLKINLFYKDFNTVIILDNRLAEIFKIDFNTLQDYKNVTHISTGFDNTLWVFNQDTQELELFDYKTKTTRVKTLPVQTEVLDLKSNYNSCWLLTKNYLYLYNYFGSLLLKIKNNGYTDISESNENIILKNEQTLFYLKKNTENINPISIPNFLINQFFVTNETLYIYEDETLHEFLIKTN